VGRRLATLIGVLGDVDFAEDAGAGRSPSPPNVARDGIPSNPRHG
jgi:hypothetical protein